MDGSQLRQSHLMIKHVFAWIGNAKTLHLSADSSEQNLESYSKLMGGNT